MATIPLPSPRHVLDSPISDSAGSARHHDSTVVGSGPSQPPQHPHAFVARWPHDPPRPDHPERLQVESSDNASSNRRRARAWSPSFPKIAHDGSAIVGRLATGRRRMPPTCPALGPPCYDRTVATGPSRPLTVGSLRVNVAPRPGPSLWALTWPPWACAMAWAMVSPMPLPRSPLRASSPR